MRLSTFTNIRTHWRAIAYILIAIISLGAALMLLSCIINDNSTYRLRTVMYLGDAAVLMSFYWLCRPKLRWLSLPVAWIIFIFALANALYFRYWGDLMPLSSIFTANNYNDFVLNSIPSLFTWTDSLFIILPLFVTVAFLLLKPQKSPVFSLPAKCFYIFSSIALYGLGFFLSVNSTRHWHQIVGHPDMPVSTIISERFGRNSTQYGMWKHNGLCGFIVTQIINYPEMTTLELNGSQRASLNDFIELKANEASDSTVLTYNKTKNLVFIIVESLNAWTINKEYDGHQLTPVLSSLVNTEGTISSTNMLAQINDGGSSDGQLIYNTGLLPLLNGVAAQSHASNRYPSLAEALQPAISAEFIVESAGIYNHRKTSEAYSYDLIHDQDSLLHAGWDSKITGDDDAVFDYAFSKISDMPQPFFAEITTLSMHYPFDIRGFKPVEWIDSVAPDDYYLNHYLQTVHYADAAIGRFLSKLAASPFADNTIIVIASDHDEISSQRDNNASIATDSPIVLIILGSGVTKHIETPIGQVDVFPTILNVMGVSRSQYPWRGLGSSILNDGETAAISRTGRLAGNIDADREKMLRRAFNVSDSLIRSNFFSE